MRRHRRVCGLVSAAVLCQSGPKRGHRSGTWSVKSRSGPSGATNAGFHRARAGAARIPSCTAARVVPVTRNTRSEITGYGARSPSSASGSAIAGTPRSRCGRRAPSMPTGRRIRRAAGRPVAGASADGSRKSKAAAGSGMPAIAAMRPFAGSPFRHSAWRDRWDLRARKARATWRTNPALPSMVAVLPRMGPGRPMAVAGSIAARRPATGDAAAAIARRPADSASRRISTFATQRSAGTARRI